MRRTMAAPGNIAPINITDDLGFRLELKSHPQRIISLVPSWTETLFAMGLGNQVVGVTKFCVEPADGVAAVEKIGGTKNPDLRAIAKLEPDFVIANAEENRREDVEKIREHGVPVFTTIPRPFPARWNPSSSWAPRSAKRATPTRWRAKSCATSAPSRPASASGQSCRLPFLPHLEESMDGVQCRYLRARRAADARL